jgi:hypothetical protein
LADESTPPPQVRAVIVRAALKVFDTYPKPIRDRLVGSLPPDLVAMRDDINVAWAPLSYHIALIDSSYKYLDLAAFRKYHRDITLAYLDLPLLKGLLEACIRLFGLKPRFILRWAPRAWGVLFRNSGRLEYDPSSDEVETRLWLRDFPRKEISSGTFPLALAAAMEAAFSVTKTTGTVTVASTNLASGDADLHARHI